MIICIKILPPSNLFNINKPGAWLHTISMIISNYFNCPCAGSVKSKKGHWNDMKYVQSLSCQRHMDSYDQLYRVSLLIQSGLGIEHLLLSSLSGISVWQKTRSFPNIVKTPLQPKDCQILIPHTHWKMRVQTWNIWLHQSFTWTPIPCNLINEDLLEEGACWFLAAQLA